jgi:uncharacterized protein YjbI with pentapeptide repeats
MILQDVILQGVILQGVILQGVTLQGVTLQGIILHGVILQGIILQGVTSKTTTIRSYRLNYIQIQNVIFKLCYFKRQNELLEESNMQANNCGAHIKMAKDCGQVTSHCISAVAVTMTD